MGELAIGAIAIAALIVLLLAIPIHLAVRVEFSDRLRGRAQLRWLFAKVDVPVPRRARQRPGPAPRPVSAAPRSRPANRALSLAALLRTPGLLSRIVRLATDLLGQFRIRRFELNADYGLADPADTGRLCGVIAPVLIAVSATGARVSCRPIFDRSCLTGACVASIRVRPIAVLGVVVGFLASRPVWRAIRAWRSR
jgi:hypothetical protein